MVINKSHAEHAALKPTGELHLSKIRETLESESANKKVKGWGKETSVNEEMMSSGLLRRSETMVGPDTDKDVLKFTTKTFDTVKQGKRPESIGVIKLDEMMCGKSPYNINNADDFDYLLWAREPKELALSVTFAQMLNFEAIEDSIDVSMTAISESLGSSYPAIRFDRDLSYNLYYRSDYYVRLLPNIRNKEGPKGDMVKLIHQSSQCVGLTESIASKAVGTEVQLLMDENTTKMNAIRNSPLDMRQMALKAVLLKLQLTMAYATKDNYLEIIANELKYMVRVKDTTDILDSFPSKSVIVDVTKLSPEQRALLLVLCEAWPSQKLKNDYGNDIYSLIQIEKEDFELYSMQGGDTEIVVNGILSKPQSYWSSCVQLFMNLGGLSDLINVVRETRGLAPILVYCADVNKSRFCVVSPYPMSTCYYGLDVSKVQDRKYVAPTILESSTLVLLVDNMLLSVFLTNMCCGAEQLGFGSTAIYPSIGEGSHAKIADVLSCYNLATGMPTCQLMDLFCPWICPIGKFYRMAVPVIMDIVRKMRCGHAHELVCYPLQYKLSTRMNVSSMSLVRSKQNIDINKITGFHSDVGKLGQTLKLVNWYSAMKGNALPRHGPSMQGVKLRGNEITRMREIFNCRGDYILSRVLAIADYTPQRSNNGDFDQTFFHKPGYLEAKGAKSVGAKPVDYRTSSFSFLDMTGASYGTAQAELPSNDEQIGALLDQVATLSAHSSPQRKLFNTLANTFKDKSAGSAFKTALIGADSEGLLSKIPLDDRIPFVAGPSSESLDNIPVGVGQLISMPDTQPKDVPYTSGNCGLTALSAVIPGLGDKGYDMLNIREDERLWLNADELAMVANGMGYNLLVRKPDIDEYYTSSANDASKLAVVYQDPGHFRASTKVSDRIIKGKAIALEAPLLPLTALDRDAVRKNIVDGQRQRTAAVISKEAKAASPKATFGGDA